MPRKKTPGGPWSPCRLDVGDVHVRSWATEGVDATEIEGALAVLSPDERVSANRFRFEHDRRDYILAHALLRRSLSEYADVAPAAWRFETEPNGKPRIANAQLAKWRGAFNLTHIRGLVACAITSGAAVGIDVECFDRRVKQREVARRWFSREEVAQLDRLAPREQSIRFYELWTLKEAFIKAIGRGLSQPLNHCRFDLGGAGAIVFTPPTDIEGTFRFGLFAPTPRHRMAVAVRRVDEGSIVARSIESNKKSDVELPLLRASAP
jgi:4'-phosphopantetheinyl transferase